MKKLLALLMALTMTVQLVTPAWADAVEDGPEETTETVEGVQKTEPEDTEETEAVETTEEVTDEVTEETTVEEPTEETEEVLPEDEVIEDVAALEAGVVASGTCGENLSWILTEDGVLRISGYGAMPDYSTSSVAPWYSKRTKITSVVVEPGVTNVGDYAFYACLKLAEVELAEEITDIGQGTFQDCTKLKAVEIPEGVTSIRDSAFRGCGSLMSVSIPEGVTRMGRSAFSGCSNLTSMSIPEGVTSIEYSTFFGCSSLASISIPEGVTSIGWSAFQGCSSLMRVNIPDSVTSIKKSAFSGCSSLASVSIPDSVTSIENSAFSGCSSLASVSIPDSVTSIEYSAFSDCSSLTSVSIPEGVTSIGRYTFSGCNSLTSVSIPEGVMSIGHSAFSDCSSLTSVSIPEEVTSIENSTFSGCSGLTSVNIPDSVTSIGQSAFSGCSSLTSVSIPEGVTSIGRSVFQGCSNLTSVSIPDSVTSIEYSAFYGCRSLMSVSIPKGVTSIGVSAFRGCSNLTSITIPEGITSIEQNTFWGCSALTTIGIPSNVTSIGSSVFSNCSNLQIVYYGGSEAEWKNISIDSNNHYLTCAQFIYGRTHECILTHLPEKAPTCTENGNHEYYYCPICKKAFLDAAGKWETTVKDQTLDALGHTMTKTDAVAPTHTTPGTNAYYICQTCHKVFRDEQGTTETTPEQEVLPRLPGIADGKSGALTWIISDEGVLTVSGKGRMPDYSGNALAPWYDYKDQIQAVVIEEGVLSIGAYAFFDCENLMEIQLPSSLKQLRKECFEGCDSLKLLDMSGVPGTPEEKITDLQGLAKLDVSIENLVGNNAAFHWELETVQGESDVKTLAELRGSKLEVLHSGRFRLVCTEGYTGLSGSAEMEVQSFTVVCPEDRDRMISGETLELSAWTMPFKTELAVHWSLEEDSKAYASISDTGVLTAKAVAEPVEITVLASPVNGEETAKKTIRILPKAAELSILADGEVTGNTLVVDLMEKRVLGLTAQIQPEGAMTTVTWTSDAPEVASVDEDGMVTLLKPGTAVIQVASMDGGASAQLTLQLIQPRDKSPRLDSTKLTLNSNLTAGTTTALVESYNNTIQSVTLYDYDKTTKLYKSTPSETFAAEAEDGTLTVRALGAQKNGTYQLKLVVTCLGGSYDFTLQVKVANSLPKVTVKQIGKFDTFYLDSTAQLTATASGYEVERLELVGADSFWMDEDGNLFYAESYNPGDKIVTKGTLLVYVEGYQVPVEKAVTIATTKTAPKLTLNPSASAVNRALEEPEFRVKVLWKGNALNLTDAEVKADVGFATVEPQGQYLVFRLTGTTGGTAKLSLRLPNWAQAVSLTHKITVDTKLPTVKLGVTTLKLNSLFSAQTAETSVWLTQGNLDISTMDFEAAREEGKCIDLSFDPETDSIEAKFNPEIPKPKAGTYSYTYTAYLEDGTALKNGTIKVTVAATAPKVKLSAASVKLNRCLAGQEKATVKVTLTGGTGYQVTDFEGMPDYMRYDAETSELTVVLLDETFTGETCTLYPVVRDEESGQEVPLSTRLTLKVQTLNTTKLTVSLSAKGKLDTVDPDSAIAYTVTKVNNCLGTVEGVDLVDQDDGDLFQVDLDTSGAKPLVLLRLLPGESYATNKTYKVQFCFTVCGTEVRSSILSVKVNQTALKVTAPKTAVYYLSQSGPLRCSLKANLPLESVALSARTAKEFQQALGGQENLRLVGNRLEFKLTNPSALKAGKSYSVQLELLPENAAENTKPTTIKLTVKVMK